MKPMTRVLVVVLPILLLLRGGRTRNWIAGHWLGIRKAVVAACLLAVFAVVFGGLFCVATERIGFQDGGSVLSIAAAFRHGQPMYPGPHAAVEYGYLYGPAAYLIHLPPMLLGLERIWTYQLWSLCGLLASVLLLFLALRRVLSACYSACLTALFALMIGAESLIEFGIKSDPWILFFTALGFWAATVCSPWTAALLIGVSGASLIDLKATLPVLALLPCLILASRSGTTRLPSAVSALLLSAGSLLPFALPGISLSGYRAVLKHAASHGMSAGLFVDNLQFVASLAALLLVLFWLAWKTNRAGLVQWTARHGLYLAALVLASGICVISGSKKGAGVWHCMPIVLLVLWTAGQMWSLISQSGCQRVLLSVKSSAPFYVVVIYLLLSTYYGIRYQIRLQWQNGRSVPVSVPTVEKDLIHLIGEHSEERLQIGPADERHQSLTTVKSILYIRGTPLVWDENARGDNYHAGVPMTPEALASLADCRVTTWIFPRGAEPFSLNFSKDMWNPGDTADVYPRVFREIFLSKYRQVASDSKFFDLWTCSKSEPRSSGSETPAN